jgi:hypothetical protein
MASIKNTQDEFSIELTTGVNLTDDVVVIKYISPNGTKSQWNVTIIDIPNGVVQYINPIGNFLLVGTWNIWAHITRDDGRVAIGDVTSFTVRKEGI